jgi:hypothetical protein
MATQRPLKEGSVRTYQEKVALGFPDILASEVDADLDTIYAAWNDGVATANLNDASVTEAKLAPDAHLWTAASGVLTPVNATMPPTLRVAGDNLVWGTRTAKGRLSADVPVAAVYWLYNRTLGAALDDPTIASWGAAFATDTFWIARAAPSVTGLTTLLQLDAAGALSLPGATQSQLTFGARTIKGRIASLPGLDYTYYSTNSFYNGSAWVKDNAAQPSWRVVARLDQDQFALERDSATPVVSTQPFLVRGSDGKTVCSLANGTVTAPMLAATGATRFWTSVGVPASFSSSSVLGAWITIVNLPMTTSGGVVLVVAPAAVDYFGNPGVTMYLAIFRDAGAVVTRRVTCSGPTGAMQAPLPTLSGVDVPPAGAHTYSLRVFVVSGGANAITPADNTGALQAIEFC